MIIDIGVIIKQSAESVIRGRGQCSSGGVILLVDKAHDVAIDIAAGGTGEVAIAVRPSVSGIGGVVAAEGYLVASVGEGNGLCISVPCGAVGAVLH